MKPIKYLIFTIIATFGFIIIPKALVIDTSTIKLDNGQVISSKDLVGMYASNKTYRVYFNIQVLSEDSNIDISARRNLTFIYDLCMTGAWVQNSPYKSNTTDYAGNSGIDASMSWVDLNRRCPGAGSTGDSKMYRMTITGKWNASPDGKTYFLIPNFNITTGPWGASMRIYSKRVFYSDSSELDQFLSNQKAEDNSAQLIEQNKEAENTRKGIWGTLKSVLTGVTNLPGLIWDKVKQLPQLIWDAIKGGFEAITNGIKNLFDFFKDGSIDDPSQNSFFGNFESDDNGGVSGIVTAPLRFIKKIGGTCSPLKMDVLGADVELPCGDTLFWNRPDVESFRTIWNILFGGLIIYRLLLKLFDTIHNLKDPDNSKVEVMDL